MDKYERKYQEEVKKLQADVSRIESGKANPGLNTLLKITKALEVNLMLE